MDKERIENKLMWMNVDPWDSYRWLAEYVLDLEDKNAALNTKVAKLTSTNSESAPCCTNRHHVLLCAAGEVNCNHCGVEL